MFINVNMCEHMYEINKLFCSELNHNIMVKSDYLKSPSTTKYLRHRSLGIRYCAKCGAFIRPVTIISLSHLTIAGNIDVANKRSYESYLGNPCEVEFNFTRTAPEEIMEIICKMKPHSSSGLDNISCRLMKDISDIIAIPLTLLVNQSLQSGIFPDKLKIAKVVPISKAGKDNIDSYVHNYRPISLLSCFSKIFERIVYNQLYNNLQLNKLLYESQYGFRKSH